jgi:hypothetical protein
MVPGQVELQDGVAVNDWVLLAVTVGSVGLTATELRVTTLVETVIIVEVSLVTLFSVALT